MKQPESRILLMLHKLSAGGQERQFFYLARQLKQQGIKVAILVSYSGGTMTEMFQKEDIQVLEMDKRGRSDIFGFLLRLIRAIRLFKPTVIYGGGLIPLLVKPVDGFVPTVWAVRASDMDMSSYHWLFKLHEYLFLKLTFMADAIICNSNAGKNYILKKGSARKNIYVIGNGFDTEKFQYTAIKRLGFRSKLNIQEETILIGVVARLDPMKDHETFVYAMQRVMLKHTNVKAIIVGDFNNEVGSKIVELIDTIGLTDRFIFTGHENDLISVYSGMDILVLSSQTEAFPNVVAEGMLCGLPVVSTRVGDCETILGESGWLVPIQNAELMSEKIEKAIESLPGWNRELPRRQVIENYSIEKMGNQTYTVLKEVGSR